MTARFPIGRGVTNGVRNEPLTSTGLLPLRRDGAIILNHPQLLLCGDLSVRTATLTGVSNPLATR